MKKSVVFIAFLMIIILVAILFLTQNLFERKITGAIIEPINETHTLTKAICDKNNYCEDYEIICNGNKTVKINPTGYSIQQPSDWQDSRDKETLDNLCD